ncbi:L,D-transpeptidase family protein [Streptomyces sp. NPDC006706]|uniref:L,D-transpeptidase family protein n=1 Tax=Streptomyces sp. NPDC006706 TaxID=3364761 RepID=UPI00369B593B
MRSPVFRIRLSIACGAAVSVLSGCGTASGPGVTDQVVVAAEGKEANTPAHSPRAVVSAPASADASPSVREETASAGLPGVGPQTSASIPEESEQVVLVTGNGINSPESTVVLYERTASGWQAGSVWQAHNALQGWTEDHHLNDLRSPIGVFRLTDAGGLLPDPGARLPYSRSNAFTIGGTGFAGEPLAGSFDYVVAINYNREAGTSPLDWTRPLGAERGGGIWLHVDHGGPTHGCVSLRKAHMKALLLALDPARHPVIVMGDAESLAR